MSKSPALSRWSSSRYTNMEITSYIPPEAMVYENGQFLRAFLLRVLSIDMQRMLAADSCDQYFANIPITPEYDASGNRTNMPAAMIAEKRLQLIDEVGRLNRTYVDRERDAKSKDLTRKVLFSAEQMETGAWGALLGARGAVHQQLEKETRCKIALAGRGITNPLKDSNPNANKLALEDPHVRITASNEADLQTAAERIEWILSDDPEAEEFREKNRRRMAQVEGRYDPRTWQSGGRPTRPGEKRSRAEAEEEAPMDEDLEELLEDL